MNLMDVNVSDQSLARGWQGGGEGGSSRGGASAEAEEELQAGVSEIASNRATGDRGRWITTPKAPPPISSDAGVASRLAPACRRPSCLSRSRPGAEVAVFDFLIPCPSSIWLAP